MTASKPVAVYERRVRASAERVWENVRDWEHLPSLHHAAFAGIECEDAGRWGWRARIRSTQGPEPFRLELAIDEEDSSYHSRTIEGPGAGTDIFTRVTPVSDAATDVRVEFFVPGLDATAGARQGERFVQLYTQLWDEDEGMMQARQAFLDGRAAGVARGGPRARTPLGPAAELHAVGSRVVAVEGEPFRVVSRDGTLYAHTTVCPHWGGPLDAAVIEAGAVVCPWHGYRFDLATGAGPPGQNCRLLALASVEVDANGDAWILVR